MKRLLIIIILLIPIFECVGLSVRHNEVFAQYNPSNPSEPFAEYKVTVSSDPAEAGYVSGSGKYQEGNYIWISTSQRSIYYKFRYWTLNGVRYSDDTGFYYTVTTERADFVAHYEYDYVYDPSNPSEPNITMKNRLYLKSEPEGCCSFNRSNGEKIEVESYVWLGAYPNQWYEFQGWYQGSMKVSDSQWFNYYMQGDENVTLTAKFKLNYNPSNPDDPSSQGGDIQNIDLGDVNEDGTVDTIDAAIIVEHYLNGTTSELKKAIADVDGDGTIDTVDAAKIIQNYLGK